MLYERWKAISSANRNELALWDLPSNKRWTFAQLEAEAEKLPACPPVLCASAESSDRFILDVLRAWRDGVIFCPLDAGQPAPALPQWPERCAHVKTTSGSEGVPRMIAFTASQLAADSDNIVATMKLRPDCPNVGLISLAHSYGFSNLILPLLLSGVPLVVGASRLPEGLRQACSKFESVTVPGVPALWRLWHQAGAIPKSIRLAISAGAPLSAWLEREIFDHWALKVHNFYGASECGGICYDASPEPRSLDEDVGAPMENVRLEQSPDGCLVVHSQAAGKTYWPSPDPSLGGQRFQTHDRARFSEGRVFLEGRQSDVINLAGQKVSPESIEQALLRHGDVRECVVFGVPGRDELRSELVVACVWAETPLDAETLRKHLLLFIPAWQLPRQWWFQGTPAQGARGKISRHQWREKFLARERGATDQ
jgi:acyl-coenzyme A synthetase/AMP-(fatty) acid ligase